MGSTHFVFGPDGRLYFNYGNAGRQILDSEGRPIVDAAGNVVAASGSPYREGMVFRSHRDGKRAEVLAHNFRNNYEVAVNAHGTLWQSDNDDDGNLAVRINYVMEGGNFGYRDELTGAHWSRPRTGMHPGIPVRHWHQRDRGVVPNVLLTGAGSPAGIAVYEGELLPEVFHGQIVHADASPGVVRAYSVEVDGTGYRAVPVPILRSPRDQWFRPSDVAVAPDGSLFVADWYDATVGGNQAVDLVRGRIYRVAPPGAPYQVQPPEYTAPEGAVQALISPNTATRARGYMSLEAWGMGAKEALVGLWETGSSRHRARALWLLGRLGRQYIETALKDPDPDLRVPALRVARSAGTPMTPLVARLVADSSARVLREAALSLRYDRHPDAAGLWAALAERHRGRDRWYLEALGIAADGQWDRYFGAWLENSKNWDTKAGRDIVWRARSAAALPYLARLARDTTLTNSERDRYFRAFDFHTGLEKYALLQEVAEGVHTGRAAQLHRALMHLAAAPADTAILAEALDLNAGTPAFLDLIDRFDVQSRPADLRRLAFDTSGTDLALRASRLLLRTEGIGAFRDALASGRAVAVVPLLQASDTPEALDLLEEMVLSQAYVPDVRRRAVGALARTALGQARLLDLLQRERLPEDLKPSAASLLLNVWAVDVRKEAEALLGLPSDRNAQPLPPVRSLVAAAGNLRWGEAVYANFCSECHGGSSFGPGLAQIGSKLTRQALFVAILHPAAGITYGYQGLVLMLSDGSEVTGYELGGEDEYLVLWAAPGVMRSIAKADIASSAPLSRSLMPDLKSVMTRDELVDVVTYLHSLK